MKCHVKPIPPLADDAPEWMRILYADIAATGSITKTAQRIGVNRTGISQIIHKPAGSNYANGKASPAKLAEKVMNSIGMVVCPFLSGEHDAGHRITGLQCREYAYRANPPTNSPRDMRHWRACQGCDKRVKPGSVIAAPVIKLAQKIGRVGPVNNEIYGPVSCLTESAPQQAGIIDTVTLPLPEVGAPQIAKGEPA